jgi:4-hydroxy-4-methyl-2-oxoglutarate aldolase
LRRAILGGDYAPGQRLVEEELAAALGVTRASLRAALLDLATEGLVERVPNRGARVRVVSSDEAVAITECRMALEGLCAAKAALAIGHQDAASLRRLGDAMTAAVAAGDARGYSDLNAAMHQRVREISGQYIAVALLERLNAQLIRYQYQIALRPGRPGHSLREHLEIIEAIAGRRPAAAEEATRRHLASVIEALRAGDASGAGHLPARPAPPAGPASPARPHAKETHEREPAMRNVVVTDPPRADLAHVDQLAGYGVATVHEAIGRRGYLGPGLRPNQQGTRIAGTALTVVCWPGDNLMIHAAVEQARPGDIIVVTTASPSSDGGFGELLATSLAARGVRGLVMGAGLRDTQELREMGFPAWTAHVSAQGTVKETPGAVNVPVVLGGQVVRPGDAIVADDDGVCAVPRAEVAAAAAASGARVAKEEASRRRLAAGELGLDMYGLRATLARAGVEYISAEEYSRRAGEV